MNALNSAQAATRAHMAGLPLEALNPSDPTLFESDTVGLVFELLRREDPVHLTHSPFAGTCW